MSRKCRDTAAGPRGGTMSRRRFLGALGGATAAAVTLPRLARAAGRRRPNIVLVMADDLGAECLGCYGGTSYGTPHLDALARTGVRFENAYTTPLCSPTRVQVMTGRYPFRTGWTELIGRGGMPDHLDPNEKTFGHLLRDVGYATALAGKWQLAHFSERPDHVRECGFDESCCWTWKLSKTGGRGSRYWNPSVWQNGRPLEGTRGKYGPDLYCDFLIDFMKRNRSRPFLAYYPMTLVHRPWAAPPGSPRAGQKGEGKDKGTVNFAANVAYMDALVGRITSALDEFGLRENTLIIFTGDNGTDRLITSRLRDRTVKGEKNRMTEAGCRVPFIANWKGSVPAGQVRNDLTDLSDVMPTLAELAGARLPRDVVIDGRSIAPQLLGLPGTPRKWVFVERGSDRFVRDERWRLDNRGQLCDLTDRYAARSLHADDTNAEARAARARLQQVLDSLGRGPA